MASLAPALQTCFLQLAYLQIEEKLAPACLCAEEDFRELSWALGCLPG